MTYSLSYRKKVLEIREQEKLTIDQTAKRFNIGVASIVRWIADIQPKQQGRRKGKIDLEELEKDVEDYPDAYQYERANRFDVAQSAIQVALKKLGITYKKSAQTSQSRRREATVISRKD